MFPGPLENLADYRAIVRRKDFERLALFDPFTIEKKSTCDNGGCGQLRHLLASAGTQPKG
jgi:hypothetical protein